MGNKNLNPKLLELFEGYRSGLYTRGEVNSICMDFMMDRDDYLSGWRQLPEWVRKSIFERLSAFNDFDQVVSFGHGDPKATMSKILMLKIWLKSKGEI